jgi:hypothetical protein
VQEGGIVTTTTRKRPRARRQGTLDRELGVIVLDRHERCTYLALALNVSLNALNKQMAKAGVEAHQRADLPGFGRWVAREEARRLLAEARKKLALVAANTS